MKVFVAAGAGVILAVAFAIQLWSGLNADVSWLITVSERMLAGQQLYVDILELNPPMSPLLYLPWVALAQVLHVPPEPVVLGAIVLATVLALGFTVLVLRPTGLVGNEAQFWLVTLAALALLPGDNFGEREHIAVILLLPLIAVSALRALGLRPVLWQVVVAGVAGGLVMAIKPHFAVAILLVALCSAAKARAWRPIFNVEHVLAGAILLGYGAVAWSWFPAFFTEMLPLAGDAYVSVRQPIWGMLSFPPTWPLWIMTAGLGIVYRREAFTGPNAQYLAAALGFFLAYLVQGKGFIYHMLPTLVLLAIVFARCFLARNAGGRQALPMALTLVLITAPGVFAIGRDTLRRDAMAVLQPYGPGLKLLNLSPHLEMTSPLHRMIGATLVNSGPCLWISLGALRRQYNTGDAGVTAEMVALQDYERGRVVEDMQKNPPDIILAGGDRFDWLGWAQENPELDALLEDFEAVAQIGRADAPFHILRRKPS